MLFYINEYCLKLPFIPTLDEVNKAVGLVFHPDVELSEDEAAVYFIDVGQGDCELISCNGYNILIDSGKSYNALIIVEKLKRLKIDELNLVIVSHMDEDHYASMSHMFEYVFVDELIVPEMPDEMIPYTNTYNTFRYCIARYGIKYSYAHVGDSYYLGEDSRLDILAPVRNDYAETNNYSICAKFIHGENSFLFTGDIEEIAEGDILEAGVDLDADVLKVAHHGSAGSSTLDFLNAVSPEIAVVHAGENNRYDHPRAEVLVRLAKAGCNELYITFYNGNIVIVSDGKELRPLTERERMIDLSP